MAATEPPGSTGTVPTPTYIGPRENGDDHAGSSLWAALAVNFFIGLLKLIAWFGSGSAAVFSESMHSFGDAVNSVLLIWGNKQSQRPPDRTHPYGYALEANLWTVPACTFLIVLAGVSVFQALNRLSHVEVEPSKAIFGVDPFMFSVIVLVVSIFLEMYAVRRASLAILDELDIPTPGFWQTFNLAFVNYRRAVGPTTRFVFMEDVIAFTGVVLALVAVLSSHFAVDLGWLAPEYAHYPDVGISVLIAGLLITMAILLFRHNRGVLTQSSAAPTVEKEIKLLVIKTNGVSEVLDLKTIDHGQGGLTVHLQVQVDPYIQVKDVDDLTDRIKERVQTYVPNISKVFVEVLADESEIEWGEKFEALIDQGKAEGVLELRDAEILRNVYDFTISTVRDIMIPRIDVEFVELQTPLSEVADLIIEPGHTRLPV